jgi:four helix bundle protein
LATWERTPGEDVRINQRIEEAARSQFRSEIEDALASIMKNISEGYGRWYHKEFAQFLRYARGSTFEVAECVKDGVARGYWTVSATPALLNLCEREQKALAGFIKYLKSNPDP